MTIIWSVIYENNKDYVYSFMYDYSQVGIYKVFENAWVPMGQDALTISRIGYLHNQEEVR